MSYNGSGTFQINSTGQPVVGGTIISSATFNALTADLATGLTTAITKDGQTTTTARIPFALGINSTLVTDASSTTTGSIITAGGVGIAKKLYVGTDANIAGTLGVTGVATFSVSPVYSSLTASSAVATDASKALVSVTNTGTGSNVLATSPTITTATLASANLTTALTLAGAAGTNGQVLTSAGSGLPTWVTPSGGFTLGTPINATSGTVITFTGISAGAKQVIVNFKGVSSNSTSNFSIQLGTSGGFATSGYESQASSLLNGSPYIFLDQSTTLFVLTGSRSEGSLSSGSITFTLENASTNIWVAHGLLASYNADKMQVSGGYVTLSGALTQLRIQALGDTFDAGAINIAYI